MSHHHRLSSIRSISVAFQSSSNEIGIFLVSSKPIHTILSKELTILSTIVMWCQLGVALIKLDPLSSIVISGISGHSGNMSSSIDILTLALLPSHPICAIFIPVPASNFSHKYHGVVSQLQAFTFSSGA